jgi:hypothetical protein
MGRVSAGSESLSCGSAGADPADTDPADTDPADTDPADTDPADTDPADTDPASVGAAHAFASLLASCAVLTAARWSAPLRPALGQPEWPEAPRS